MQGSERQNIFSKVTQPEAHGTGYTPDQPMHSMAYVHSCKYSWLFVVIFLFSYASFFFSFVILNIERRTFTLSYIPSPFNFFFNFLFWDRFSVSC